MEKKFRTLFVTLLAILFILSNLTYVFSAEDGAENAARNVTAKSYILIDNKTQKVLYSKNENEKMYPASTTKILTAILVIENCNLNDTVTASYDAVMSIPSGYSNANIQIGEELTVEQLLNLLLVYSANDAANVLAEYTAGSVESFVSMMNTKLHELGLNNSHFTNTYGKHDENHYTTSYDLANIMKYCLKNDVFRKLAGQASCSVASTNKSGTRLYTSTNELIVPNTRNYYKYLTCGKTGTTTQAKQCLVSSAYRDNLELICVILGSESRFSDTRNLYEYAFSNYSVKNIANKQDVISNIKVSGATKQTKDLDLLINQDLPVLINNSYSMDEITPKINLDEKISAPIDEGSVLGTVKYNIDGIEYEGDLIASHSVEKSKILMYILYLLLGLLILFVGYKVLLKKKKRRF